MKRFAGIFTPIPTPFRADDTLDEAGLRANIGRWMQAPLTGLFVRCYCRYAPAAWKSPALTIESWSRLTWRRNAALT